MIPIEKSRSWSQRIKLLDVFPKDKDDVTERSSFGALITIFGSLLLTYLFINELIEFATPTTTSSLHVNYDRGEKMRINIRIAFLSLPCDLINIDVADRLGGENPSVNSKIGNNLNLIPFRADWNELSKSFPKKEDSFLYDVKVWNAIKQHEVQSECLSCYDAAKGTKEGEMCCNHCHHLAKAYTEKRLDTKKIFNKPQCQNTPIKLGCAVSGFVDVNKVAGGFHIAAGPIHEEAGHHHHHFDKLDQLIGFNSSHYISHISFGREYPGLINPLDKFLFIERANGQQQYFLQVVPTRYQRIEGRLIDTNQFSVTYQYSNVDFNAEHYDLPGVYFRYDISPIAIDIEEKERSISHLFTRLCAVIGGIWVVIGILYSVLNSMFGTINSTKIRSSASGGY